MQQQNIHGEISPNITERELVASTSDSLVAPVVIASAPVLAEEGETVTEATDSSTVQEGQAIEEGTTAPQSVVLRPLAVSVPSRKFDWKHEDVEIFPFKAWWGDKLLFEADCLTTPFPWMPHVEKASRLINATRPSEDVLHDTSRQVVPHPSDPARIEETSRVFRGTICSGGQVLRNPTRRDQLRDRFQAKAVEMEGSGLAEATWLAERGGFLIVRGACDYCDTFKSDEWQRYAAVVAAAYVRALLESIPRDT